MSHRPSLIYAVCLRFDGLKAIGLSRHSEKRRLRADSDARGETRPVVALSTGRIHADKTLETYKGIALRYAHWARATYGVRSIGELDARASLLVTGYLRARVDAGDSPYSLKTTRSALRMFYRPAYTVQDREDAVRHLGADVALPLRRRENITRSRHDVAMDREIVVERYHAIIAFCRATGVRRRELAALVVADVSDRNSGLIVRVRNGKGGKERDVPVLPGQEDSVHHVTKGRGAPETIFPRVPVRLDIHSYRREYAQALYCAGTTRPLPAPEGRLAPGSIDQARALYVSHALGHARVDIMTRHYLR